MRVHYNHYRFHFMDFLFTMKIFIKRDEKKILLATHNRSSKLNIDFDLLLHILMCFSGPSFSDSMHVFFSSEEEA